MVNLTDRRYIVTGAAGGIGGGIVSVLLERRARVALFDLDETRTKAVASRFDPDGQRTMSIGVDVTDPTSVSEGVARAVGGLGGLEGLVNNAGSVVLDTAWDAAVEDWSKQLEVNVIGTFLCSREVGRYLQPLGGAIVNVSSNCGKVGYKNMSAYNAAKAAVISLTRSLSMEWAEDRINVNAVCPGGVDTPMLAGVAEWLSPRLDVPADELLAGMGAAQLGRKIAPVEVAKVIAFLLSDDALIIRGQAINVDGGDTPY
ncbi:MAG: SDR family oxidoreductase [Actinobacteria bacterium]|nr:SDR family oxidoreductase [Actinomycetota bacterium]